MLPPLDIIKEWAQPPIRCHWRGYVNLPDATSYRTRRSFARYRRGSAFRSSDGKPAPFLRDGGIWFVQGIDVLLGSFMTSGNEQVPALSLHERNVIVLANALEHEKRR